MFKDLFTNKKKLIIVIVAVVVILAGGGFAVYSAVNNAKPSSQKTTYTQASADSLKDEAVKAMSDNNTTKARSLFVQAKEQYKSIGDANGEVNVDSLIYLIDHPSTK